MTGRLDGKFAVITGAAGGIGSAAARGFVGEGAYVGLVDLPGERLTTLADELAGQAVALPTDLTDEQSIEATLLQFVRHVGQLNVVYACAGIQDHEGEGPITEVTLDTWNRTLATNATGTFLTLKHAVGHLVAGGGGSVIVCGSPTGMTMSGAANPAYSSSKAAAMALTRIVAADYAAAGVRANVIVPGTTRTGLIAELLADPEREAELTTDSPIGRIERPEELVGMAVYLASDESSFTTAAVLAVDGGLTAR